MQVWWRSEPNELRDSRNLWTEGLDRGRRFRLEPTPTVSRAHSEI